MSGRIVGYDYFNGVALKPRGDVTARFALGWFIPRISFVLDAKIVQSCVSMGEPPIRSRCSSASFLTVFRSPDHSALFEHGEPGRRPVRAAGAGAKTIIRPARRDTLSPGRRYGGGGGWQQEGSRQPQIRQLRNIARPYRKLMIGGAAPATETLRRWAFCRMVPRFGWNRRARSSRDSGCLWCRRKSRLNLDNVTQCHTRANEIQQLAMRERTRRSSHR